MKARISGEDASVIVECEDVIDGIPVNPVLPHGFGQITRPELDTEHTAWRHVPYIVRRPSGHWECRMVDDASIDRPTLIGLWEFQDDAIESLCDVGREDAVEVLPES
jgi:hypothetical protein